MLEGSLDKIKASLEDTLSTGNINFNLDGTEISVDNNQTRHEISAQANKDLIAEENNCNLVPEAQNHPTVYRPATRISAFSLCNPSRGSINSSTLARIVSNHGPLFQASKPQLGGYKFLDNLCSAPMFPQQCGHGCCTNSSQGRDHSSLLGPDFIEYEEDETLSFSSHELISIAIDLNNIAWIKSGLDNSCTRTP